MSVPIRLIVWTLLVSAALAQGRTATVREIASNYTGWGRVDDQRPRWAPELCSMPSPGSGRFSESPDDDTHGGGKLFYLYAADGEAYRAGVEPGKVGQVIVKESFAPVRVQRAQLPAYVEVDDVRKLPFAVRDGVAFRAGEPRGLFIMFREAPDTPDTDDGWVYATVDVAGEITAMGRVESCMSCHEDAPMGRLFGLRGVSVGPPRGTEKRWQELKAEIRQRFDDVPQLTTADYAEASRSAAPPMLVDVRPLAEYRVAWIPGAVHIEADGDFVGAFAEVDKQRRIVLYCSVGWRSSQAAQRLLRAGYTRVFNLEGSIFEWANEGRRLENRDGVTQRVHPYDRKWGQLLRDQRRAERK